MDDGCNKAILKTLDLAREMLIAADEGDAARDDVGCGVLFGTLRDCAYKIRALAESEMAEHKQKGKWGQARAKGKR